MPGIVSKHQKINNKRNIMEDDAHGIMNIKILLKFYFYDMHVVSGKCKQLFQHTAHAPLQNVTSVQDGKSKISHAVPFPTHRNSVPQSAEETRGGRGRNPELNVNIKQRSNSQKQIDLCLP